MKVLLYILYGILLINLFLTVSIVILERKQPERTIAWLMVLILIPPVGLVLYIFLGRNWKLHRLNDRISDDVQQLISPIVEKLPKRDKLYVPLIKLLANNSDSPVFVNNNLTIFIVTF